MEETKPDYQVDFDLGEIRGIANELVARFSEIRIWLLEGNLGAGKTTLVKALGEVWRVEDEVVSPSFPIVNEYATHSGSPIYHLDLYRLKNLMEAMEIGLFELAESGYVCLIEWASAIGYRPSEPHLVIELSHLDETKRHMSVFLYES